MTVAVPVATPVKLTEHVETVVDVPEGANVQLAPTVPTAVFDDVKLTEPLGAAGTVGGVVVSVTVAVHVEVAPAEIEAGLQTTAVDVLSIRTTTTVIMLDVPGLPA